MATERNFEDDIKINKFKLDDECEKHSSIYLYWAMKLAKAKNNLNKFENQLKLISAENEMDIRKNWNESKNGKQTENGIRALLEISLGDFREQMRMAQNDVFTYNVVVNAFEHRKDMLKCEKELLIGGFYASPTITKPRGTTEAVEKELRNKLNKKKPHDEDDD